MKTQNRWLGVVGVFVGAAVLAAGVCPASAATPSVFKMKSGACQFTLLDSKGVKPLAGAALSLTSAQDGRVVVKVISDKQGLCNVEVAGGRYIVAVDNVQLAVLEAADTVTISECRIVVPESGLQVGGQAPAAAPPAEGAAVVKSGTSLTPFIVGGSVILAGGTALIVNEALDDEDKEEKKPEEQKPLPPPRRPPSP